MAAKKANKKPVRYRMHVKKGDIVQVIAGSDKAKVGEVLAVFPKTSQVIVKGVNLKTKHVKPRAEGESGKLSPKRRRSIAAR